jgi:hypothetical protein
MLKPLSEYLSTRREPAHDVPLNGIYSRLTLLDALVSK